MKKAIPAFLFSRRKQQKKTQKEVADAVGISWRQYQRYESGERSFIDAPYWLVRAILEELNISDNEFDTLWRVSEEEKTHGAKKM
ncbi:MAG: hypothetical protein DBY43_05745 [Clostridiaceae bacterium]|nr:MAG: hypothetical protein DBY43_05745 [Clostridiaceae bacterium]